MYSTHYEVSSVHCSGPCAMCCAVLFSYKPCAVPRPQLIVFHCFLISLSSLFCRAPVASCHPGAEFIKAAIMQSHDCAKYLRICSNLGLMNANQEKLAQMLYIYHNLAMFSSFTCFYVIFYPCFCAKLSIKAF